MNMMNVKVKMYDGVKYDFSNKKVAEVEYKNIKGYEVAEDFIWRVSQA